ncbi:fatty acyl-AMP ligase [Microbispora sp. NPDC049125]|uniref:fatty acyl-AMP ligase n=1 Tax=Microbispora sp. NPDC049125 TaxID=3154929 RepID=UPI003466B4C7
MTVEDVAATMTSAVHPARAWWEPGGPLAALRRAPTLGAALASRAQSEPGAVAYYLQDEPEGITVGELYELAGRAASALVDRGVSPGDRVGVCLDTGRDLLATIFGCQLAGAVPFLTEPAVLPSRRRAGADRIRHMIRVARPRAFVVDASLGELVGPVCAEHRVPMVTPPFTSAGWSRGPAADPDELALIQFTSGTTKAARGVALTHRAAMANIAAIGSRLRMRDGDLTVGWLPLHHDMGMIGILLSTFMHGVPVALLSPMSFALSPERWLRTISYFRGTISAAPNFAYRLCATRLSDAALKDLDLSSWRAALNGAEVVDAPTVRAWQERMRPYGLHPRSMVPCYGMAEIGLAATFADPGSPVRTRRVDHGFLRASGRAVDAREGDVPVLELVSCGPPLPGVEVRITGEDGRPLPGRTEGDIRLRTSSAMNGYYGDPEETRRVLGDGWLRTGDRGLLIDGELYVTGRIKDLIIIGGRNYTPYEIEAAAADVAPSGTVTAAVGCPDPDRGEALVVLVEFRGQVDDPAALRAAVVRSVSSRTGLTVQRVVLVRRGSLPKTSSGKLRRPEIVQSLIAGRLPDAFTEGPGE